MELEFSQFGMQIPESDTSDSPEPRKRTHTYTNTVCTVPQQTYTHGESDDDEKIRGNPSVATGNEESKGNWKFNL